MLVSILHRVSGNGMALAGLGVLLGMLSGYLRGVTEIAVMRLVDIFLSIPAILLAITFLFASEISRLAVGDASATNLVRVTRTCTSICVSRFSNFVSSRLCDWRKACSCCLRRCICVSLFLHDSYNAWIAARATP